MSTRHKQAPLFNQTVQISTGANGFLIIPMYVDHTSKTNHFITATLQIAQPNPNMIHDVKLFVMTGSQLIEWLLSLRFNNYFGDPIQCLYSNKQLPQHTYRSEVSESRSVCFLIDNRYSSVTSKTVDVSISEEWDESITSLDLVTTIPPHDDSIKQTVENLVITAKTDLKIITPYIDMSLISQLLSKHKDSINIQIITRSRSEFSNKGAKEAYNHINKNLGKNHRVNEHVHSRIIIRDSQEALVSSADLTQDSLLGQFNAGIVVSEPNIIRKLGDYFKRTWESSSVS